VRWNPPEHARSPRRRQATQRSALSTGITAEQSHALSPPARLKVRSALGLPGSYRHLIKGDKENRITATCRLQATDQSGCPTNVLRYCEPRHAGEAKAQPGMASTKRLAP
jgi:hypothetical protein